MNSICIWLTPGTSAQSTFKPDSIECHFNLWMLNRLQHRSRGLDCFLDIGLMLSNMEVSTHINLFVPDQIDKTNLQDLGLIFKDRTELVSALFNEEYAVLTRANEKAIEVQNIDGSIQFYIYMLDMDNDVIVDKQFGGSIIRIRIPDHLKQKKHYYRIRLKCAFVAQTGYIYTPPASSFLEGAFFQTELIDFRVNEKRNLPRSLLETLSRYDTGRFKKTHFFLMREASDDYVFSHKPPGGRQLEKDIWKDYVGSDYSFERITAYHWKEALPHDSFNVFVKFRAFHSNLVTILIAIGAIIILGTISGVLGNLLYSLFCK
jgi:hypothetical protein